MAIGETSFFFQILIAGILMGGVYSLASLGLTITYGTMDFVNFAHGSFMMLGMYMAYWLFTLAGLDPYAALPLIAGSFFLVGYVLERVLIERILKGPRVSQFLITYGLLLFVENLAVVLWTTDIRTVDTFYYLWSFKDSVSISFPRLVAFVVSLFVSAICYIFLARTWTGLAIRATAEDKEAAETSGVDIHKIHGLTFGLGISLVAMSGLSISIFFPMHPYVGITFLTVAFAVCVLGGLGNYMGAFIAGIIVGVAEAVFGCLIGPQFKQMIYLILLVFTLLLKPKGLFGGK